jgi:hypothetical protein
MYKLAMDMELHAARQSDSGAWLLPPFSRFLRPCKLTFVMGFEPRYV